MKIALILVFFMLISLVTLFSIGRQTLFERQLIFWLAGWLIFFSSYWISYKNVFRRPYFGLVLAIVIILLVGVFFLPSHFRSGLKRGLGSFQPSEFGRIGLLLILSVFLAKFSSRLSQDRYLLLSFVLVLPLILLILLEPDFGTALIYFLTWFFSVIGFMSKKQFFRWGLILILIFIIGWLFVFKPYQKERVLTLFSSNKDALGSGYNLRQLKITIGSAGIFGRGLGGGTEARLGFLPSSQTDFILDSFVEEWGLVGFVFFLFLVFLFLRTIYVESRFAADPLAKSFAFLLVVQFGLRFVLMTAVDVGLFPIMGVPVPFLSYGGSYLISDFILLAIWRSFQTA